MNSMTGFGKGEHSIGNKTVVVELKSVNHRFLDLYLRLPSAFSFAEDFVRNQLKTAFARGHIEVSVSYSSTGKSTGLFDVNQQAAVDYYHLADTLSQLLGIANDLKISDILTLPSVITEKKDDTSQEQLQECLSQALSAAVTAMSEMRAKEGASLKNVLLKHLHLVTTTVDAVKLRAPLVVADYREKLSLRIKEYLGEIQPDEARLLNEVAFYSDRVNVDEEINRLYSHISQVNELLDIDSPCGKKLDFLVQEMNREVNTLGSKANDTELRVYVIELKNELEKIREQVQNLE